MDFEEFCDVCRRIPATTEDDLLKAFHKIDINGDGYLSNSELRRVLTTVSIACLVYVRNGHFFLMKSYKKFTALQFTLDQLWQNG